MESVLQISKEITARYQIPLSQVLGHSDIAPGRKVDPGHLFNWKWLAEHGIGLYPVAPLKRGKKVIDGIGDSYETKETEILQIQSLLAFYGYEVPLTGILDEATQAVIKAFQMHFWPTSIYKKDIGPGLIKRLNTLLSYCEPLNKIRSI
jgi:N-acetylmuramoyl-L-alanine amidase